MPSVERRRSPRYVVTESILVVIDGKNELDTGTLVNISSDGVYVATSARLSPGDRVTLILHVPDSARSSLWLSCMVAWSNVNRVAALSEGYGFEFLASRRTRESARKLIEELRTRNSAVELVESGSLVV
jgi:Tfp pilus assembly protein PilZ